MSKEVAEEYLSSLMDLTINSKNLINMLTMLAEENAEHGAAIVQAIESHIEKVSPDIKLPILYLIDSIVKNVGAVYIPLFANNIINIFASVFEKVDDKTRFSMFKLRQTWNDIFPATKMYTLDVRIQHIDPNWPSLSPHPGIHVNPKFLNQGQPSKSENTATPAAPVSAPADSSDLRATFLKKQKILLELQEKKKQLEQMQKTVNDNVKQTTQSSPIKTKIAPANSILIEAAKQRDPRLARLQKSKEPEAIAKPVEGIKTKKQDTAKKNDVEKSSGCISAPSLPKNEIPEVKKTEDQIQQRQMVMLKTPVLVQMNRPTSKNKSLNDNRSNTNKSKRHRSPDVRDPRSRDKRENSKNDEKLQRDGKSLKKSRENKPVKSSSPKSKEEENTSEKKREKRIKQRIERKVSSSPDFSPSPSPPMDDGSDWDKEDYKGKPIKKLESSEMELDTSIIAPEAPPPPVFRQQENPDSETLFDEDDNMDEAEMREEALKTQHAETVGFKDMKRSVKGRNYSRRNKELSPSPEPDEMDLPLRSDLLSVKKESTGASEESVPTVTEKIVDTGRDVDLRMYATGSPAKKRLSSDSRHDEPPTKKGKGEDTSFQLFGNKDMDERLISMQRLPSPPTPPVISTSSRGSRRSASPDTFDLEEPIKKEETDSVPKLPSWEDDDRSMQSERNELELRLPKTETVEEKPSLASPAGVERDRLGRPLLYNKLPLDPRARRESLGTHASHDLDNREYDLRREDNIHVNDIINHAQKQLDRGTLNQHQYGQIMAQIVRISEKQKIDEAMRMGKQKKVPSNNDLPPFDEPNQPRFGDIDYRQGPNSGWRRGSQGGGRYRGERPGSNGNMDNNHPNLQDQRRREDRITRWDQGPELMDTDSRSQDSWGHELDPAEFPQIPPPDPMELDAIAADPVKFIAIDGTPRPIRFYGDIAVYMMSFSHTREISFEDGLRRVNIAGMEIPCRLNGPPVNFLFQNVNHSLRLGAPTRELYVDGRFYEIHFGGAPMPVDLGGVPYTVHLEGPPPQVKFSLYNSPFCLGIVHLIIDARMSFQVFLDAKPQRIDVDGRPLVLRFLNALTTILINGMEVDLKFGGTAVPIWVDGTRHFLRLTELPPGIIPGKVVINGMENRKEMNVDMFDTNSTDNKMPEEHMPLPNADFNRGMYLDILNSTIGGMPEEEKPVGFNYQLGSTPAVVTTVTNPMPNAPAIIAATAAPVAAPTSAIPSTPAATPTPAPEPAVLPGPPAVSGLPLLNNLNINDLYQSLVATGIIAKNPEPSAIPAEDQLIKKVSFSKPDSLREKQPGIISILYSGIQCGSCGVRFSPQETVKYSRHLDWHFRQNRRDRDAARRGTSRRWYYDVSDWIQFEEIEDLEERAQSWFETEAQGQAEDGAEEEIIPSVAAPPGDVAIACAACQDRFDTFFHQETEEWNLRNCVMHDDKYFHPACYQDSLQESDEPMVVESVAITESISEPPLLEIEKMETEVETLKVEESIVVVDDVDEDKDDGEIEVVTADEEAVQEVVQSLVDYVIAEEDCEKRGVIEDDELEVLAVTNKDENKPPVDIIDVIDTGDEVFLPPSPESFDPDKPIKQEPLDEMESALSQVDQTVTTVVTSIDGNVVMVDPAPTVTPPASRIRITFNKPATSATLESVKETTTDSTEDPTELQIEELDPDPLPLKPKKPRIAEREMTVYPPCKRGSEISGLCSIM